MLIEEAQLSQVWFVVRIIEWIAAHVTDSPSNADSGP